MPNNVAKMSPDSCQQVESRGKLLAAKQKTHFCYVLSLYYFHKMKFRYQPSKIIIQEVSLDEGEGSQLEKFRPLTDIQGLFLDDFACRHVTQRGNLVCEPSHV